MIQQAELRRLAGILATGLAASAAAAGLVPASAGAQTGDGVIVFESDRQRRNADIWTMRDDGSALRRLTDRKRFRRARTDPPDTTPDVSPDGERILFASGRDGDWDLYEMDFSGEQVQQVTDTAYDEFDAVYSPDGKRIIYEANPRGNWDVLSTDRSGQAPVNLTRTQTDDLDPDVLPDGSGAVLSVGDRRDSDIVAVDFAAPGKIRPLVAGPGRVTDPAMSPAGDLAFARLAGRDRDLYVLRSGAERPMRMTGGRSDDSSPAWTGDGRILFVRSTRGGTYGIYSVAPDGSRLRRISRSRLSNDTEPAPRVRRGRAAGWWTGLPAPIATLAACKNGNSASNVRNIVGSTYNCSSTFARADRIYSTDGLGDSINGGTGPDHAYADDFVDNIKSAAPH